MRGLAVVLTLVWAATAIAVAVAYRPGGPLDIVVALMCFGPVLVCLAGVASPPVAARPRHRAALVWLWIAALLFAIPVLYGVLSTLAAGGSRSLVPSMEAAYSGLLAVFSMALFSVVGLVHARRHEPVFETRPTLLAAILATALTVLVGAAFVLVAVINDEGLRAAQPPRSSYGPTDPDLQPPFCDGPPDLGPYATINVRATSSLDDEVRGTALLEGRRAGIDEAWGGTWDGPDGSGRTAYLRIGRQAWLNDESSDRAAPGRTWQAVGPDPFGLAGADALTMDGPPHAWVDVPRGAIVAEDLGLDVVEGARARHCRTFMDGPTALVTFLPLRWLLHDGHGQVADDIRRWRGEMDWWVFGDGELGRATVQVSGSRADTTWEASGVQAVLRAELEATDRDLPVDLSVAALAPATRAVPPASAAPSPAAPAPSSPPQRDGCPAAAAPLLRPVPPQRPRLPCGRATPAATAVCRPRRLRRPAAGSALP